MLAPLSHTLVTLSADGLRGAESHLLRETFEDKVIDMRNHAGLAMIAAILMTNLALASATLAEERLPWEPRAEAPPPANEDPYAPGARSYQGRQEPPPADPRERTETRYRPDQRYASPPPEYRPREDPRSYREPAYGDRTYRERDDDYRRARPYDQPEERYQSPPQASASYDRGRYYRPPHRDYNRRTYSQSEIVSAGHRFFGKLSKGLAQAIEYAFRSQGRPTGYILGEDAGGAFIAGLRYGEGYLHTKFGDRRKVFWQGPSIGYDFGGEGSRTMVLVYSLTHPGQIYRRFGGVQGSAYVVGGASLQILKAGHVTLAPIRTGVGLRLGANVGYLKYTRRPTWNPF